jgi:hypothetical protein
MHLEELIASIRRADPAALADPISPEQLRLVQATLGALGAAVAESDGESLEVPGLGSFRRRKPGAAAGAQGRPRITFVPLKARPVPVAAPAGAKQSPVANSATWRQALKSTERPLVDPQGRFITLFSAKSACSSVVIWFFKQLGCMDEARGYAEWPHRYRIERWYKDSRYLEALAASQMGKSKVLRVVRDPVERAGSSFRHALGTRYAKDEIQARLGIDIDAEGLSFERFIDFLGQEDLDHCNPHHRRQKHAVEDLCKPDFLINASRQDLFEQLNAFERSIGLPHTDFPSLTWLHELQAGRTPHSVDLPGDPYRLVLTREQAQRGPWPKGLITGEARARLETLYAEDIELYA